MTRRRVACALLAVAAAAIAVAATTDLAEGFTGTPAAKRLARQALAFYKHVHFVSSKFTGDVIYCPQFHDGYFFGPPGPRRFPHCRARAVVTQVAQITNGRESLRVGHVTAPGKPQLTFVSRSDGRHVLDASRGCWRTNQPPLPVAPPFFYSRHERLTIAGHHGGFTILKGRDPRYGVEWDRIDTRTHEIRGVHQVQSGRPRLVWNSTSQAVTSGPTVPAVTPAC